MSDKHSPGPWTFALSIPDRGFEAQVFDAARAAIAKATKEPS